LTSLAGGDRFNVVPDSAIAVLKCAPEVALAIKDICRELEIDWTDEADKAEKEVRITANGVPAHAMEPEKGENAVQKLLSCLVRLDLPKGDLELLRTVFSLAGRGTSGEGLGIKTSDEVSGPLTCNLASINLDSDLVKSAIKTKEISIKLDIRYPVTADYEKLIGAIKKTVSAAGAGISIVNHKPPLFIPESHEIVRTLLDAYEAVTGDRPRPISMGGGTYCRFMQNSVSSGPLFPGQPELAHQVNERVALDDIRKSTHIYAEALARFNEI
jgi:succinyl-diaminopimelate desuccinylase